MIIVRLPATTRQVGGTHFPKLTFHLVRKSDELYVIIDNNVMIVGNSKNNFFFFLIHSTNNFKKRDCLVVAVNHAITKQNTQTKNHFNIIYRH